MFQLKALQLNDLRVNDLKLNDRDPVLRERFGEGLGFARREILLGRTLPGDRTFGEVDRIAGEHGLRLHG